MSVDNTNDAISRKKWQRGGGFGVGGQKVYDEIVDRNLIHWYI